MFTQPIAFVIGAGASAEYGMPTGAGLLKKIAFAVRFDALGDPDRWGDPDLYRAMTTLFRDQMQAYETAGVDLAKYIASGVPSIDDALTWFSSRPEVVALGKLAIANEILKAEKSSSLYSEHSRLPPDADVTNTWIPHFLSMVMDGHKSENAETAFEKLSIINFNYDRTIEHFIYSVLQSKFGLTETRARQIVNGINMFRPYGTVGVLRWQGDNGLSFGARPDSTQLLAASRNILTFSEGITGELQSKIRSSLDKARLIIFLGFGFHNQNMERLRVLQSVDWRRAYATAFQISPENRQDISEFIKRTIGAGYYIDPLVLDWSAHKLLTDLRLALMAASTM
jgi:hypothetical protein